MTHKISNIVVSTEMDENINLLNIRHHFNNIEYEPEIYFAAIYRIKTPKVSILVNSSGKIVITGAKSLKDIEIARDIFFKDLIKIGYHPVKKNIIIQNIVVTFDLKRKVNLEKLQCSSLIEEIRFNPKKPGALVVKSIDPKFTALLYSSGKILIAGIKNFESIDPTISKLKNLMKPIEFE